MKKEYYWILMEKIWDEWDLSRTRLVPRWDDWCYSIKHDKLKEAFTWKWDHEVLNNL